jgi:molybdenum cofactor biosynthesis enzyme MoaA
MNNRCNGNCWFCIDKNNYRPKTIDVNKMIESVLSEEDYQTIDITGGEPFLDFDVLVELLKGIRPYKKKIILNTNGSLLSEEKVEQLNGLIDELRIALHHYNEQKNSEIIKTKISFEKIKKSLELKKFKATFNMVITKAIEDEKETFIEKLTSFCHDMNVDAVRISEVKYVGENHGYEEYAKDHIKAFDFFKNLNVIKEKTSEELIRTGCIDIFYYKGIEFHLKRLCGYKLKSNVQTFKVVYSSGEKADDWIYDGIAIKNV